MTRDGFIVTRIERETDRTLLYGNRDNYHVIASAECRVKVGDQIVYERYGANFGWLIEEK